MSKPNLSLGSVILKIGIVSFVLAALVATTQSLMLYMGGDTFGASQPATITATISSWIITVIGMGLFQSFFLCILTFIFAIGFSFADKVYQELTPGQQATVKKLLKWAAIADLGLALLVAIYNGSAQYAIFSALHADPALNLVTSLLAGLLTLIYSAAFFAFFGTVATIVFGSFLFVLSGGLKKRNQSTEAPKNNN